MTPLSVWLLAVNIVAFVLMGADKLRAMQGKWRIPEAVLLLSALLGGALGAWMGMLCFHHKTNPPKYTVGVPVILLCQMCLKAWFLLRR